MAKGPDGAGELTHTHVFGAGIEADQVALISAYQLSSLRPKVVGSAWMPWVRPMVGVCLNSSARARGRRQRQNALTNEP